MTTISRQNDKSKILNRLVWFFVAVTVVSFVLAIVQPQLPTGPRGLMTLQGELTPPPSPQPNQTMLAIGFAVALVVLFGSSAALVGSVRKAGRSPRPQPTQRPGPSQLSQRAIRRQRRKLAKEQRRRRKDIKVTAMALRRDIQNSLATSGFRYVYKTQGAVKMSRKVRLSPVICTSDSVYYRIAKRPQNTQLTDYLEPEVAQNISLDIGRFTQIFPEPSLGGVWIQVDLKSGVSGIPTKFPWHDEVNEQNALDLLPKTKKWKVPIGLAENRQFVNMDMSQSESPHLLVAGSTGTGKSVFMNQMLCTLISRNDPAMLKLLLIDLKGGLEFWPYEQIPHLWRDPVIRADEVSEALQMVIREKERRFTLFRQARVKNIKGWNKTQRNKVPYIYVFFDEIQNLMLQSKLKRAVEGLIVDLAAQGRALGIQLVLCTQYPNRDVVSSIIKANIPNRMVFQTDETGSKVCLGNEAASRIPGKGRAIFRFGNKQTQVQAPLIADEQITAVITSLTTSDAADAGHEKTVVTANDLFAVSIHSLNGKFSRRALYEQFGGAAGPVSQPFIGEVTSQYQYNPTEQGPVIEFEGGRYILHEIRLSRQMQGNWLIPVNGHLPQSADEVAAAAEAAFAVDFQAVNEAVNFVANVVNRESSVKFHYWEEE